MKMKLFPTRTTTTKDNDDNDGDDGDDIDSNNILFDDYDYDNNNSNDDFSLEEELFNAIQTKDNVKLRQLLVVLVGAGAGAGAGGSAGGNNSNKNKKKKKNGETTTTTTKTTTIDDTMTSKILLDINEIVSSNKGNEGNDGERLLYMAAKLHFVDGITTLLEFGANPNLTNNNSNGYTPLIGCIYGANNNNNNNNNSSNNNNNNSSNNSNNNNNNNNDNTRSTIVEEEEEEEEEEEDDDDDDDDATLLSPGMKAFIISSKSIIVNASSSSSSAPSQQQQPSLLFSSSYIKSIRLLLEYNANPNQLSKDGKTTPLFMAASYNDELGVNQLLLGGGGGGGGKFAITNPNVQLINDDNQTALHVAASNGSLNCLRLLLKNGANPNIPLKSNGNTSLHIACCMGYGNCVKYLLYQGNAIWDKPNKVGQTPLCLITANCLINNDNNNNNTYIQDLLLSSNTSCCSSSSSNTDLLSDTITTTTTKGITTKSISNQNQINNITTTNNNNNNNDDNNDDNDNDDSSSDDDDDEDDNNKQQRGGGEENYKECIRLLIERGESSNTMNPLKIAIELSNKELVDIVLKTCDYFKIDDANDDDDDGHARDGTTITTKPRSMLSCKSQKMKKKKKDKKEKEKKLRRSIRFLKNPTFVLYNKTSNNRQMIVFLLQNENLPWKAKHTILDRCFEDDDIDQKEISLYLHASLVDLSSKSISSGTVSLLIYDFFYRVLVSILFLWMLSRNLQQAPVEKLEGFVSPIMQFVGWGFMVRAALDIYGNGFIKYFEIFWNWVNLIMIVLIYTTCIEILEGKSLNESNPGFDERFRDLTISTIAFMFLSFIGSLRVTFVAFSQFVGGLTKVMVDLLPFLCVTTIVLFTFTTIYYIKQFGDEGYETFSHAFGTVLTALLAGPDEIDSMLDVLFGILSIVILLNVVIAIISTSWDAAVESSFVNLCYYRLQLFRQVDAMKRSPFASSNKGKSEFFADYDDDYDNFIETRILSRIRPTYKGEEWWHLELSERERSLWKLKMKVWKIFSPILKLFLRLVPWLLGLITFGKLMPKHIREYLFGIVPEEKDDLVDMFVDGKSNINNQTLAEGQTGSSSAEQQILELQKRMEKEMELQKDHMESELSTLRSDVQSSINKVKNDIDDIKEMNREILSLLLSSHNDNRQDTEICQRCRAIA